MSERNVLDVFESGEVQEVLRDTFYSEAPKTRKQKAASKQDVDYEVICISLYKRDLARLDSMVRELKAEGHRKLSRSSLIRYALATIDTEKLPRPF